MAKQGILNDEKIVGSPIVHLTGMVVVLFAFWMVMSGRTETKFIVYGVLTAAVSGISSSGAMVSAIRSTAVVCPDGITPTLH